MPTTSGEATVSASRSEKAQKPSAPILDRDLARLAQTVADGSRRIRIGPPEPRSPYFSPDLWSGFFGLWR